MNMIFAEMIMALYGVPVDFVSSLMHGWKLGRNMCYVTGFLVTLSGKYASIYKPKNNIVNNRLLILKTRQHKLILPLFSGMASVQTLTALSIQR